MRLAARILAAEQRLKSVALKTFGDQKMADFNPELSKRSLNSRFIRHFWSGCGGAMARIFALPLFLIVSTGWLPNKYLDLPPKKPCPWTAIIGLFLIFLSLAGLFLPVAAFPQRSWRWPSGTAEDSRLDDRSERRRPLGLGIILQQALTKRKKLGSAAIGHAEASR